MLEEKECEKRRSARREGVLVERECEYRRSASREGVRVEKERVQKECE